MSDSELMNYLPIIHRKQKPIQNGTKYNFKEKMVSIGCYTLKNNLDVESRSQIKHQKHILFK